MKVWEWFTKLPKELRYLIAGIVALILIVATSVTSALAWYTGYTPDKLDLLLTKHGSQQQLDSMKDDLAGGAKDAIDEAVSRSQQWTMEYLSTERQLAVDTSFKPAVQLLYALKDEVRRIKNDLKITNDKINDIPNEDKLKQLIEDNNDNDRTAEMLEQVLRRMDQKDVDDAALRESIEELKTGKRVKIKL
jgi:hypothetical protein